MPISMEKRVEAATVSLQKIAAESKIDLGDVSAQVTVSADRSGSAYGQWPDVYQEAIERALALTLTGLDDDGEVPFIAFDSKIKGEEMLNQGNYEGFVKQFHDSAGQMGGTAYAPVIDKLLGMGAKKKRFGKGGSNEKNDPPFLHLFFTDGAPHDGPRAEELLIKGRTRPHFFQIILIGGDPGGKRYADRLNNDLSGPGIDNIGVTIYDGMPASDDTAFFNDVISEFFLKWLPEARKQGITTR